MAAGQHLGDQEALGGTCSTPGTNAQSQVVQARQPLLGRSSKDRTETTKCVPPWLYLPLGRSVSPAQGRARGAEWGGAAQVPGSDGAASNTPSHDSMPAPRAPCRPGSGDPQQWKHPRAERPVTHPRQRSQATYVGGQGHREGSRDPLHTVVDLPLSTSFLPWTTPGAGHGLPVPPAAEPRVPSSEQVLASLSSRRANEVPACRQPGPRPVNPLLQTNRDPIKPGHVAQGSC